MPKTLPKIQPKDPETAALKIPPHSIEAEQAVLGGVLLDNGAWEKIADSVSAADFYRKNHRLIFEAINALDNDGQPFDLVTVAEWLESRQQLDDADGLTYLTALVENTPGSSNVKAYADIVRKRSVLRQLIRATNAIAETVYNPEGMSDEQILDRAEQNIFEIAEGATRGRQRYQPIKALLTEAMDRIDKLQQQDDPITGIATGFYDLDRMTAGLQPADLIVIAGRPSMGKTALAINIAEQAVIKNELSTVIFSMEMPGNAIAMRMIASLARIDQHKIKTGKLADLDWPRLTSAVSMLESTKLFIDDTEAMTPTEIRARSRRLYKEHHLDLIIIDYMQLMQIPGSQENRTTEISEISRSLKAMARELNIPVVVLSQLNRSLEQRPNKRPIMSDLRESGAIEQDADVILFIYRDEVYNEESKDQGIAEIIISKQRNGPIGTVKLAFLGQYTRFENYTAAENRSTDE